MLDFVEPAQSSLTVSFYQCIWKLQALLHRGRTRLLLSPEVSSVFARLKDQRVIICANHPMEEDGPILFALSAAIKQTFLFLAAREIFGHSGSKHARILQKLGCYSVQRGLADIHAFKCSCELLSKAPSKIVIFPEGEVSYRGNFMRDFESGPELIALSALNNLRRSGSNEKVFILPVALKYEFSRDQTWYLAGVMQRIERALKIDNSTIPFYRRIRLAFDQILEKLENDYSIPRNADLIESRIFEIGNKRIEQWANLLNLCLPAELSQVRKIHLLMNAIAARLYGATDGKPSEAERKFFKNGIFQLKQCISLMAVRENDFRPQLNQEDAMELLRSLTWLVLPGIKIKRPDTVLIGASTPIDVEDFLPKSAAERKNKVSDLKRVLRDRITERRAGLHISTIGTRGRTHESHSKLMGQV